MDIHHGLFESAFRHEGKRGVQRIEKHYDNTQHESRLDEAEDTSEQPVEPSQHREPDTGLHDLAEQCEKAYHERHHQDEDNDIEQFVGYLDIRMHIPADEVGELESHPGPGEYRHQSHDLLGQPLENALHDSCKQHEGQYDIQYVHAFAKKL